MTDNDPVLRPLCSECVRDLPAPDLHGAQDRAGQPGGDGLCAFCRVVTL